ncbi:TPA: hypothetical protein QDB05_000248 [Burkholderia vietnamiensis]|nr:hypothetical protein [Burkholderia vietnamiensis]
MTAADCLARFKAAVREGRRGQYGAASEIVERVRQKAGDEAAKRAKKELWAYIKSGKAA